jgi:uncharacterized membrane protein YphA (DoxX/SURF4 family)
VSFINPGFFRPLIAEFSSNQEARPKVIMNLKNLTMEKFKPALFFVLRITIGWHFLYEGLSKLLSKGWSSAGYLEGSYGFLSGFYHALSNSAGIMQVVDFFNVWGLILIGAGLFLGVFIRIAATSGILLLLLYYFAYPPFGVQNGLLLQEGHFWIINRNLMEAIALGIVFISPSSDYSILNLFSRNKNKPSEKPVENAQDPRRREILKGLISLPFAGGVILKAASETSAEIDGSTGATRIFKTPSIKELKGKVPTGKLGNLEVSRIIAGCNQIMGYSHARDLGYVDELFRKYNTEVKLFETFALYDAVGINTTNMVVGAYPTFNKYKKATGSNMQSICQVHIKPDDLYTEINQSIDFGATTMYIQGGWGDMLVHSGKLDLIVKILDYIRSHGMLAGIGAHSVQVPITCEKAGIRPDYYFKTMHHDKYWSATPLENREEFSLRSNDPSDPVVKSINNKLNDNMFDVYPEQTVEVFKQIDVPLIGFKVMAGGAIKPKDGFRYAFENGADFICVGMFDFQVVQNANLVIDILNSKLNRERKWYS